MYLITRVLERLGYRLTECIEPEQARALDNDVKGKISLGCYVIAIPLALLDHTLVAIFLLVPVWLIWLVPDRRIEKVLAP